MSVEKYLKRIDGCCDVCAFRKEGICEPMADPYYEPLCARLNDKQLSMKLRDCINEINGIAYKIECQIERGEQKKWEKQWKQEEAKKKRKESYYYCYLENYEIKKLRKYIRACSKSIQSTYSLEALGKAFSFVNSIFNQEDSEELKARKLHWENKRCVLQGNIKVAEDQIKELNKIKKNKLKLKEQDNDD